MTKLERLVNDFGKSNELSKILKKETSDLGNSIKEIMQKEGISKSYSNGYIANLSTIKSETFNEEKLLDFMKTQEEFKDCIKTKEYVDMKILEDKIYEGLIQKDLLLKLNDYKETKDTVRLVVKKEKK